MTPDCRKEHELWPEKASISTIPVADLNGVRPFPTVPESCKNHAVKRSMYLRSFGT